MTPLGTSNHFRPNDSVISWELIDGEVIAIHYQTGHYFSFTGLASSLWQGMSAGNSLDSLRSLAGVESPEQQAQFDGFFEKLLGGQLIEPWPSAELPAEIPAISAAGGWEALAYEEFADLEQLLLADPLHDVDDMGWPHLPPGVQAA